MNRINVFSGLLVLFILPVLTLAQQPLLTGQEEEKNSGKSAASLTTTDLISDHDFVPKPIPLPVQSGRNTGPLRKNKKGEAQPALASGGTPSRVTTPSSNPTADLMAPAAPIALPAPPMELVSAPKNSTGGLPLDSMISAAATRNGIDHRLILAVMKQESSFNSRAVSYKGARGLMQLMPSTAARFGVRDIFDPAQNIEGGARYLRFLLDTFNGDVELALAGYNAGENAVARYGNRVPPYRETQDYVRKIAAHYTRLTNGTYVRQEMPVGAISEPIKKLAEASIVSAGQTMTQF